MQEVDSNGRGAAPRARTSVGRGCWLALAAALSLAANASPAATLIGPGELIIEPAGAAFALGRSIRRPSVRTMRWSMRAPVIRQA
ncbi:MAG: hypothetical protein RLW62_00295 [Gammaproteobacteria bacterium]